MTIAKTFAYKIAAATLLAAVMWSGAVGAASAADKESNSDVTVSVPPATPKSNPSPSPWNPAPSTDPPAANNPGGAGAPRSTGGGSGGGGADDAAPTNTGPATEPTIPKKPSTTGEKVTTDKEHYVLGENVVVRMEGLTPGEQVQVVLYSEPRLIGNVPVGPDGVFTHTFALPGDLPLGTHTVQLTGWESKRVGTAEIFVTARDAAAVANSTQGAPPWVWWVAGGLGAVLLVVGAWWVLRAMRAPEATAVTA